MQCGTDPAETFKTMAEESDVSKPILRCEDTEDTSIVGSGDNGIKTRLRFSPDKDTSSTREHDTTSEVPTLHRVPEDSHSHRASAETAEQLSGEAAHTPLHSETERDLKDVSIENRLNSNEPSVNNAEEKENIAADIAQEEEENRPGQKGLNDSSVTASKHSNTEDNDAEVARRAREQGYVSVVFPGTVTQEGCCRFVSEILKCILYQRQQLPMTYDQLVYSQKKQQASMQDKDPVIRRPVQSADMDWRKSQQTLQDLEELLQQLEVLFSLSRVPRVLLLMGGSLILPKELYEINLEGLVSAGGDQCLRVSSCLRQLFRTLFVADLLSDTRPVRLMPTTVLVLAHRDCGVGWFRPKLQFKVPTRVRNQVIALSTDPSKDTRAEGSDWQDYVWFQAPMTIKGFSNSPKSGSK
ncbi:MAD2L1-binding protein [Hippoglossus hippoglossus]|uniref:MAD2L1-binding protein n=1 Tax=Hippoglossus hippoglossus TaxID=8267 RepID=UPI00148BAB28|nr:MAD2L1-binding protein [Hippoglossus hippoglossus]